MQARQGPDIVGDSQCGQHDENVIVVAQSAHFVVHHVAQHPFADDFFGFQSFMKQGKLAAQFLQFLAFNSFFHHFSLVSGFDIRFSSSLMRYSRTDTFLGVMPTIAAISS